MTKFFWTEDVSEAKKEQTILLDLVETQKSDFISSQFRTGLAIGSAYEENTKTAIAVCTKFDRKGKIIGEKISKESGVNFPYVPGLLAFRVGPAVCSAIEELVENVDLLLFDGQGIAHPLGFGLASHIGVLFNKPSIGVTRKILFGQYSPPPKEYMLHTELKHPVKKTAIGYCISTGKKFEPFFMSPGHRITLSQSFVVIKMITDSGYLPRPIRIAHAEANRLARECWSKRKNEV